MRKVLLYIAASIDGYIARPDGGIDWLSSVEKEGEDYGYGELLASIDTTLMGRKTYDDVLGFDGPFPYPNLKNYVFSRQEKGQDSNPVQHVTGDPAAYVKGLKSQPGSNIWLIGGGQLNTVLLNAGLIDEMILSIIPIILGEGIPLFGGQPKETKWRLTKHEVFDTGLVQVRYRAILL
ncbi:MAG: dihydrofolate reductase [Phaeodactylibacter sp.]|nr:dihydrofolate reductase [Phaeodactylibacter sp.]